MLVAGALAGLWTRVARALPRIRPPGALAAGGFEARCIRCFRCAEVCPPKAIRIGPLLQGGLAGAGDELPHLELRARACVLCMKCTQACPTGALAKLGADPAEVQRQVKMGRPELDRARCLPWTGRGVCRLCFYACPYAGTAVALVGPAQAPMFDSSHCVGCGLCEEACPETAQAIRIVPLDAPSGSSGAKPARGAGGDSKEPRGR